MPIAAIIGLILTEMPQVIDLLNSLRANGQTQATEEQLAALDLSETDLDAVMARLFPAKAADPSGGDPAPAPAPQ